MKHRVEKVIGGKNFWMETGELAKQAHGSCRDHFTLHLLHPVSASFLCFLIPMSALLLLRDSLQLHDPLGLLFSSPNPPASFFLLPASSGRCPGSEGGTGLCASRPSQSPRKGPSLGEGGRVAMAVTSVLALLGPKG